MAETEEREEGAAGLDAAGGSEAADGGEAEMRAEEESAKAMEAEVPHPAGYPDSGQEQPS